MFQRWCLAALLAVSLLTALAMRPSTAQTTSRYFPETGHSVQGLFLRYWTEHGGLAQQGYPLTEEFQETNQLNGQTYIVQYFERAVFEAHPENAAPFDVLLSQLGRFELAARYPNDSNPAALPITPPPALLATPTLLPPTATPTPTPSSSGRRIGAICRDGSRSDATGSGACSHHGGVDHWLYAP